MGAHGLAQQALLHLDQLGGVHHGEAELGYQLLVLLHDPCLEEPIRLGQIDVEAEIHAGLVPLERGAS